MMGGSQATSKMNENLPDRVKGLPAVSVLEHYRKKKFKLFSNPISPSREICLRTFVFNHEDICLQM